MLGRLRAGRTGARVPGVAGAGADAARRRHGEGRGRVSSRRAQNAVRDQLVAAAVAERPRRGGGRPWGSRSSPRCSGRPRSPTPRGCSRRGSRSRRCCRATATRWPSATRRRTGPVSSSPRPTPTSLRLGRRDLHDGEGRGLRDRRPGPRRRARPRTRRALPPLRAARDRLLRQPGPAGDDVRLAAGSPARTRGRCSSAASARAAVSPCSLTAASASPARRPRRSVPDGVRRRACALGHQATALASASRQAATEPGRYAGSRSAPAQRSSTVGEIEPSTVPTSWRTWRGSRR